MWWIWLLACVAPEPERDLPPPPREASCRVWPVPAAAALEAGIVARTPEGERLLYAYATRPEVEGPRLWTLVRVGGLLRPEPWLWDTAFVLGVGAGDVDDDGVDEIALIEERQIRVLDGRTRQVLHTLPWDGLPNDRAVLLDEDDDDLPEIMLQSSFLGSITLLDHTGARRGAADTGPAALFGRVRAESGVEVLARDGVRDAGTGRSLWTAPGEVRGAGDVDGDGLDEVLVDGGAFVGLYRPGRDEVVWQQALPGWTVSWVNLLDADGDGALDVVLRVGDAALFAEQQVRSAATGALLRSAVVSTTPCEGCFSYTNSARATPDVDGDGRGDQLLFSSRTVQWDPWAAAAIAVGPGGPWNPDDGAWVDVDGDGAPEVVAAGAVANPRSYGVATFDAERCELIGFAERQQSTDVAPPFRVVAAGGTEVLVRVGPGAAWSLSMGPDGALTALHTQALPVEDGQRLEVPGGAVVRSSYGNVGVLTGGQVDWWPGVADVTALQVDDLDGDGRIEVATVSADALCAWDLGSGQELDCWPLPPGEHGLALIDEGAWTRAVVQDLAQGGLVEVEARLRRGWWTPALPYRLRGQAPGGLLTGGGRVWVPEEGQLTGWRLGAPRLQLTTEGVAAHIDAVDAGVVVAEPWGVAWWVP